MPFVAFQLRLQAAARRQLTLIAAFRAAQGGEQDYIQSLQERAAVSTEPVFALVQSGEIADET